MPVKFKTIDEFLAGVTPEQRVALETLRKIIHETAPGAEECISYGLAAFRLNGKPLVAFGAASNHCAFYPMNGTSVEVHKDELKGFSTSKGTIRFEPSKPLPEDLVRNIINERIDENASGQDSA